VERADFERLVEEAMASLPDKFRKLIRNVAVIVEDFPSRETRLDLGLVSRYDLLGLYHGVPFTKRDAAFGNQPPDVIVLYQKPIERLCLTDDEVRGCVRETVIHEVGHYFGLSEAELRRIERESRAAKKE
jgi:predicted Zn-dependent protease with MMP-like domain